MCLTHSLPDFSRRHHLYTFSQNLKCGWENICRKVVRINHLDNVSSNIFQNILSVLADVTAKIPKWRRWGNSKMATLGLNELRLIRGVISTLKLLLLLF
jgi:hypothetical protein